jgi:hypothetical protein
VSPVPGVTTPAAVTVPVTAFDAGVSEQEAFVRAPKAVHWTVKVTPSPTTGPRILMTVSPEDAVLAMDIDGVGIGFGENKSGTTVIVNAAFFTFGSATEIADTATARPAAGAVEGAV